MNIWHSAWSWLNGREPVPSILRNGRRHLGDFYDASREVGIRPFLMWGTLLGCVRENGLLPHDHDLDVGLVPSDYRRKDELVAAMRRRGYRLALDWRYKLRFMRRWHWTWIDVDVFYPWQGKTICSTLREDGRVTGEAFPLGTFDRLREIEFLDGLQVLIPDPPEAVLEAVYGEWRIPDPSYHSATGPLTHFVIEPGGEMPAIEGI